MIDVALFIPIASEAQADAAMESVFGSPQPRSFRVRLSPNGEEPATHLGAYARGLNQWQVDSLTQQPTVTVISVAWTAAITQTQLLPIPEVDA